MEIGIFSQPETVDKAVEHGRLFADAGFGSYWMPQIFGLDTLTALTVVAREVPKIRLGTAVVPTYPRHPAMLAAQARTLQQVADGRFTLGIGLSHQMVIEGMFGMTFDKPVRHLREYLSILMPLLNGEAADFAGETLHGHLALDIPDSTTRPQPKPVDRRRESCAPYRSVSPTTKLQLARPPPSSFLCTASYRPTERCSTAKALKGRPMSHLLVTRRRFGPASKRSSKRALPNLWLFLMTIATKPSRCLRACCNQQALTA